jgi:hypothetical protein
MPGELEEYVRRFDEANTAALALNVALSALTTIAAQVQQTPKLLGGSDALARWPTQEELRKLYQDRLMKVAPLQAAYHQLPHDMKRFAPLPDSVGIKR